MATVLVVDDEFGISTLLKDVFEDEGHRKRRSAPTFRSLVWPSMIGAEGGFD